MGNTRPLAMIATLALLGGCATTGGKITAVITGVAAVGTVVSVTQLRCDGDDDGLCAHRFGTTATLAITTGAALFATFLFEVLGAPDLPAPATTGPPGAPGKPVATGYLPLNFGGRFSTNAAAASR